MTIGRMVLAALAGDAAGRSRSTGSDSRGSRARRLRAYYADVQGVFQDPFSSYNPIFKADRVFTLVQASSPESDAPSGTRSSSARSRRSASSPAACLGKYPHQLSGGQLQRMLIARALLLDIKLLVADEIISMLDASTRIDVLNLLGDLKARGLGVLFITHDLSLGNYICGPRVILQRGEIVEAGTTARCSGTRSTRTRGCFSRRCRSSTRSGRRRRLVRPPSRRGTWRLSWRSSRTTSSRPVRAEGSGRRDERRRAEGGRRRRRASRGRTGPPGRATSSGARAATRSSRATTVPRANSIFNSAVVPFEDGFAGVFRVDDTRRLMNLHAGRSDDGVGWRSIPSRSRSTAGGRTRRRARRALRARVRPAGDLARGPLLRDLVQRLPRADDRRRATRTTSGRSHQLDNAFLPFNRNGVLFPRRIGGAYAMLNRPSDGGHTPFGDIFYSESPDLVHWGRHRHVMAPDPARRGSRRRSAPGRRRSRRPRAGCSSTTACSRRCNGFVYSMGAALLDLDEPWRVVARGTRLPARAAGAVRAGRRCPQRRLPVRGPGRRRRRQRDDLLRRSGHRGLHGARPPLRAAPVRPHLSFDTTAHRRLRETRDEDRQQAPPHCRQARDERQHQAVGDPATAWEPKGGERRDVGQRAHAVLLVPVEPPAPGRRRVARLRAKPPAAVSLDEPAGDGVEDERA